MRRTDWARLLPWAGALGMTGLAAHKVHALWRAAEAWTPASVSDALPLFLGAKAVSKGLDPTDAQVLEQLYQAEHINVSVALFSVLYPASMSVFLSGLAHLDWPGFVLAWRTVLVVIFVAGCAAAGAGPSRGWRALFGAAVGVWVAAALFPLTNAALGLGQANLAIVGIFGLAMGALYRDRSGLAAGFATVGAGIKLVPAAALWPVLWARQWRGLRGAIATGVFIVLLTWICVPFERIVSNLMDTLAFQRSVEPHWLQNFRLPDAVRFLGHFRRPSLGLLTLLLTASCAWSTRDKPRARPTVLALSVALIAAALAADATAVGVFYSTMCIPAMIALSTLPVHRPRTLGPICALALMVWLPEHLYSAELGNREIDEHQRMMIAAALMWAGVVAQLVAVTRPSKRWWFALGVAFTAGLAQAWIWTYHPPYFGAPKHPMPGGTHHLGPPPELR